MKTYRIIPLALITVALLCLACGGSNTSSNQADLEIGVTDTEITVGSFGPLTGPAALWGNIMKGMDAYFKMVNAAGGVNGRQIKFVMKDDAYDPSRTVPSVRELVQKDEVFAFVGGIGTAPCMSVMDFIVENKIPWIAPISGGTHWSIPLKENIFSVLPYYIDEGVIQAKYAIDSLKTDKIGIIYQNDDVGLSALIGAKSYMKTHNIDFLAEVPVEVTDTDLTSHVAKLKESGADVVLLWTLPRQGVITVTQTKVINYEPQFIASFILSDMTLMHDLTKGAWEGVIYGSFATPPYNTTDPGIAKYKEALATYYPDVRWGIFPYSGFLYAEPFVEALRRMGDNVTREGLIKTLNGFSDYSVQGIEMAFSPTNHQGQRAMKLLKCTGAETYENLSGLIESDSDILALVEELEAH